MVDYSKGKIYKIWDNLYTICYVGSTTQPLSKRMVKHRCDYKRYLQKLTEEEEIPHIGV